ncbi:MAG: poly(R)-hydroxyalkanoic acid synthase subunit PhaE [Gammaproteobacteria bacterium]
MNDQPPPDPGAAVDRWFDLWRGAAAAVRRAATGGSDDAEGLFTWRDLGARMQAARADDARLREVLEALHARVGGSPVRAMAEGGEEVAALLADLQARALDALARVVAPAGMSAWAAPLLQALAGGAAVPPRLATGLDAWQAQFDRLLGVEPGARSSWAALLSRLRRAARVFSALHARAMTDAVREYVESMPAEGTGGDPVDRWLQCCERAHLSMLRTPRYSRAYGRLFNALVDLRAAWLERSDAFARLAGWPTRADFDALARRMASIERTDAEPPRERQAPAQATATQGVSAAGGVPVPESTARRPRARPATHEPVSGSKAKAARGTRRSGKAPRASTQAPAVKPARKRPDESAAWDIDALMSTRDKDDSR